MQHNVVNHDPNYLNLSLITFVSLAPRLEFLVTLGARMDVQLYCTPKTARVTHEDDEIIIDCHKCALCTRQQ